MLVCSCNTIFMEGAHTSTGILKYGHMPGSAMQDRFGSSFICVPGILSVKLVTLLHFDAHVQAPGQVPVALVSQCPLQRSANFSSSGRTDNSQDQNSCLQLQWRLWSRSGVLQLTRVHLLGVSCSMHRLYNNNCANS